MCRRPSFSVTSSLPSGRKAMAHGPSNSATRWTSKGICAEAGSSPAFCDAAWAGRIGPASMQAVATRIRAMRRRAGRFRVGMGGAACGSVAEILVLQRQVHIGLAQQGDDRLQVVSLFAADPQLVAVDLGFDLELGLLDEGDQFFGGRLLDALADGDFLTGAAQVLERIGG